MPLTKLAHRYSSIVLIAFTISHLLIHMTAIFGIEVHLRALSSVNWIYRNPIGEAVLILAILIQIASGFIRLFVKKFRRWAALQTISGIYLLIFLFAHTSAATFTHWFYGIETNFYWAAGSLAYAPLKYGFMVYYFAAIMAFFVHIAAAVRFGWPVRSKRLVQILPIVGVIVSVTILSSFAGAFYDISIPDNVAAYYQAFFGMP